ncbi:MAG: helix-turn-helix domain-containing protein, partial [Planctomycetota bacterium]
LYYRLNVINIQLPPLRDRREDIPLLVEHFVRELNRKTDNEKEVSEKFLAVLKKHRWPGNIRELQNEVRRAYALGDRVLDPDHLSPRVTEGPAGGSGHPEPLEAVLAKGSLKEAIEELEKDILVASLARYKGNKVEICSHLKIPKTTLYSKLKRYGLE